MLLCCLFCYCYSNITSFLPSILPSFPPLFLFLYLFNSYLPLSFLCLLTYCHACFPLTPHPTLQLYFMLLLDVNLFCCCRITNYLIPHLISPFLSLLFTFLFLCSIVFLTIIGRISTACFALLCQQNQTTTENMKIMMNVVLNIQIIMIK